MIRVRTPVWSAAPPGANLSTRAMAVTQPSLSPVLNEQPSLADMGSMTNFGRCPAIGPGAGGMTAAWSECGCLDCGQRLDTCKRGRDESARRCGQGAHRR